jgi:flagellar hook-associated protein 1 FlgK
VSDLFSSLSSAARSLDAQRFGMDVAGQNIANVNTPGWSRRTIDLAEVLPVDQYSAGGGAEVMGVRALRDRLLDARMLQEVPQQTRDGAKSDSLGVVEATVGLPGSSLDVNLQSFFDAFSKLADNPTSAVARQEVLLQGNSLGSAFNDLSTRLVDAQHSADSQVRSTVDQINTLAAQIAEVNKSISTASESSSLPLMEDRRQLLVRQLSELADVKVIPQDGNSIQVALGGRALVVGENTYALSVTPQPPSGYVSISSGGTDITSSIQGGKLAGYLQVRDGNLTDYINQLDTLAYNVSQQINAIHTSGYDQTGAAGGNFFNPLATSSGAAAALTVAITDPRNVAASATTDVGDNQVARQIAALSSTPVLNGGTATFSDAWGQLVYSVGRDSQAASDDQSNRAAVVSQIDSLRDQTSGVSLDEEASNLLKFQRAYEANAKFFQACNQAIDVLLQNLTAG